MISFGVRRGVTRMRIENVTVLSYKTNNIFFMKTTERVAISYRNNQNEIILFQADTTKNISVFWIVITVQLILTSCTSSVQMHHVFFMKPQGLIFLLSLFWSPMETPECMLPHIIISQIFDAC